MPFIKPQKLGKVQRFDVPKETETSAFDTFHSAFALHNSLSSYIDRAEPDFDVSHETLLTSDYDPFDNIEGYEPFADSFIESNSPEQTEWIKSRIDDENRKREMLSASGGLGIAASAIAGMSDPLMIPLLFVGGGAVNASKSVAIAGLEVGAIVGSGAAVAEVALHSTQETRTVAESAVTVSAAALLSGLIGSTATSMTKKQIADVTKAVNDDLQPRSAGAAEVRYTTLEQEQLIKAGGLEKVELR